MSDTLDIFGGMQQFYDLPVETIIKHDDYKLKYLSDNTIRKAVFEKIIEFFLNTQCFDGDSLMQSDKAHELSVECLSEIADEIIKFQVDYK